jgi:hypothetical protein
MNKLLFCCVAVFTFTLFLLPACSKKDNNKISDIIDTNQNTISLSSNISVFGLNNTYNLSSGKTSQIRFNVTIVKNGVLITPAANEVIWSYEGPNIGTIEAFNNIQGILTLNGMVGSILVKAKYDELSAVMPVKIVVKDNGVIDYSHNHIEINSSVSNQNNIVVLPETTRNIFFAVEVIQNGAAILPDISEIEWTYSASDSLKYSFFQPNNGTFPSTISNFILQGDAAGIIVISFKYQGMTASETIQVVEN